jgi:DNA invertase Pin-like site-specific DNA recombinase
MTHERYGYARVSSLDQNTSIQKDALEASGCNRIWEEQASGTSRNARPELTSVLSYLREGDTLVVTRVDRLARSVKDLQDIVYELKDRGVHLQALEQPIDTSTAAGKAFLDMLGVFAEFETSLRKERQLEGIAKAKAKGVYKGKQPLSDNKRVHIIELFNGGMKQVDIVRTTGLGRTTIHNVLKSSGSK